MSYRSHSIDVLLDMVASENVTPAGGTVAAIVGAAGAALCEMVCIHTSGTGTAAADASAVTSLQGELHSERERLLDLADADAAAVETMLHDGDADDHRAESATGVPIAIAETCLAVLEHADTIAEYGNPSAVPDAITGVCLTHAALSAALFTVRTNLERVEDESFIARMDHRADELERAATSAYEQVVDST